MTFDLPLETITAAQNRIASYVRHTPFLPAPRLKTGNFPQVHLKLENLQVGGSFKARGVFNTLLQLDREQRRRGVITASGGNHGVALAYAAHFLGIPATVYLPRRASEDRAARIAAWGAQIHRFGTDWDDANLKAIAHGESQGLEYVHPFDAETTLAGQGTLGLELIEDLPAIDCALIAIGGGGLICGVAAALKQCKPDIRVLGVEPAGAPSMLTSLQAGRVQSLAAIRTIADTLAPRSVSERTLTLARKYVNEVELVDDRAMVEAMRWLWRECNQLVEPSGAAVIAALLKNPGLVESFQHPVAVICGGNASAESVFMSYQQAIAPEEEFSETE